MKAGDAMRLERGIWHVSREYSGIAEVGGIKDVVAGLAVGLARVGTPTTVVLPCYGFINLKQLGAQKYPLTFSLKLPAQNQPSPLVEEQIDLYVCEREGVRIFLLNSDRTRSKRSVYTYTDEDERKDPQKKRGSGHRDAHHLNLILQRGALDLALLLPPPPAVFHCHDGHCALLPSLMRKNPRYKRYFKDTKALITIHNAGMGYHQEIYDLEFARQLTGLPRTVLKRGILNQAVDPLLLGAYYSRVNTVSERYAQEIITGELDSLTGGLGKAYRRKGISLLGITNGIDPKPFDPRYPEHSGLDYAFDPVSGELEGKRKCRQSLWTRLSRIGAYDSKTDLQTHTPGDEPAGLACFGSLRPKLTDPLYTFIGRLTNQKGVDILTGAVSQLLSRRVHVQFLIMGQGEKGIEDSLISLAGEVKAEGKLAVLVGYHSGIARLVYAAGDFFLVPSQYEPCGLTDFFAQMMGNLPIVHHVGGLVKVKHGFNGYSYSEHSVSALVNAIMQSLSDYRKKPKRLERMRKQAFQEIYAHYTWERVLEAHYYPLYRDAL